ncbi:TraM recognition domain-containing protein [Dyadobacter sp. LHD-138]|uniref:type IV secretory system conjugative DNA transfer family protein n=1 Tax=Dyadobacter sp. LHD-138 TaxID=3071413 RepID=UPI0027DFFBC3|nr:TraM recognition domain-containing protein [Dyadobacter sp. LHD-138]MDQ6482164.1 TraM recognition domain-containing protein [Dyadobacter sp. LHD-138]
MASFDLDQPLIELVSQTSRNYWTLRHAFEGTQIFGGIGSGKTSGSGRMISLKFLKAGFGGLILTVKPDEKDMWQEFCQIAGRSQDLAIIEPGGRHTFNVLDYESKSHNQQHAITENIVEVLKTVIRAGEEKSSGKNDDPFWETALDMLIFNVIDLCKLSKGKLSILDMYNIVQTIPKSMDELRAENVEVKAFQIAFETARQNVTAQIDKWFASLPLSIQEKLQENDALFEEQLFGAIPDARLLKFLDQFFFDNFIGLSEKTRSIIDFTFSGFLFRLLREPVYSLFFKNASTITPEDCLNGKIILINLPVKLYHKVGRDCQILFKYVWQRAMEKRNVHHNGRPVFLWADEAQNFIHEHDPDFQATARSSRVATVYISQNLPNYYASMGGQKAEYKVKSFMGTLATKIFHANADIETNKYASDLIGEAFFEDRSDSLTVSKDFSRTRSRSLLVDKLMRPEEFVKFRTGGPLNNFRVEGVLHKQGDMVLNGQNHVKMVFNQQFIPS